MEGKEDRYTLRERDHQLHLALSGDGEALGSLLVSYMPQLYRAALRILRSWRILQERETFASRAHQLRWAMLLWRCQAIPRQLLADVCSRFT